MLSFANQFSIKHRVFFQAAFFITIITIISGYALISSRQIGHEISTIAHDDIPLTKTLTEVTTNQLEQALHLERVIRYALLSDEENIGSEVKAFVKLSHTIDGDIEEAIKISEAALTHTDDKKIIAELSSVKNGLIGIASSHKSYEKHAHEAFTYARAGTVGDKIELILQLQTEQDSLDKKLEALLVKIENFTAQAVLTTEAHEQAMIVWLTVAMVMSILGGLFIAWLVQSSIRLRLDILRNQLKEIAAGNLGGEILGKDDISEYLKEMQDQLKSMITSILSSVERLSATISQVSSSMNLTANNILQQQSQTEQVATAMTEMSSTIEEVTNSIRESAVASTAANDETEASKTVVRRSAEQVGNLAAQIDNAAQWSTS